MKILMLVLFWVLIATSPQFSQTQLLLVGNAVQYSNEGNLEWVIFTTKAVNINGKEYFERKNYSPWTNPFNSSISYERIEGDSTHYILKIGNQDSLIFNFNWQIGKKFFTGSDGDIFNGQRIDSIKITNTFLNDDTVYVLKNFTYNTITNDTNFNVIPEFNYLSKKMGKLNEGMWIYITGVKVNRTRYGEVYPYPEEVEFSSDSIYIPTLVDSGSTKIVNSSDYPVRIDSIISVGSFYGYWGNFSRPGFEFPFYLVQSIPGFMVDSLGIIISPHDSVSVLLFNIDLCPVCKFQPTDYFEDTLRFVFTFTDGNVYSFSKPISIKGEGHMSDVGDDGYVAKEFILYQNYPNPFNPSTAISYNLQVNSFVTLKVYDVLGNEVAALVNEQKPAGSYEVNFNALQLSSGIYFYQLKAGSYIQTRKMILMK